MMCRAASARTTLRKSDITAGTERRLGVPTPNDFVLKVCGAGGDPPLELRMGLAQRGFGAVTMTDLFPEKPVSPLKLRRTRKRERQRHHLPDRDRRWRAEP